MKIKFQQSQANGCLKTQGRRILIENTAFCNFLIDLYTRIQYGTACRGNDFHDFPDTFVDICYDFFV